MEGIVWVMGPTQNMATNQEIAASAMPIEFDAESESFHATYDSTRDSTSLAVVAVVATALAEETIALTPLQSVIDTDALEKLATKPFRGMGGCDSISFTYEGLDITVTSEDVIKATPVGCN